MTAVTVSVAAWAQRYTFGGLAVAQPANGPLVVADFNGDSVADIAAVNSDGSGTTIGVLLGKGDGTFAPAIVASTGMGVQLGQLITTDLNADGKPDLVIVDSGNNRVSVFLGNGDGSFQPQHDFATGIGPVSVVTEDFNRDGKVDLAVANFGNYAGNTVSVLLGKGDGTFQQAVPYTVGSAPDGIAAADLNGDGKVDLAVSDMQCSAAGQCSSLGAVSILLGSGDGAFQPHQDFATAISPTSVLITDLNGDGKPDLVTTSPTVSGATASGSVSTLLGNGDGTFRQHVDASMSGNQQALSLMAAVDLDGDGNVDVVVQSEEGQAAPPGSSQGLIDVVPAMSVLRGKGDGTFAEREVYAGGPRGAMADMNGDALPDYVTTTYINPAAPFINILLGNPDGTFGSRRSVPVSIMPQASAQIAVDLNGDGKTDLAIASNLGTVFNTDVAILLSNGDASFRAAPTMSFGPPTGDILFGDFDGDGKLDLLATTPTLGNPSQIGISTFRGNGDGTVGNRVDFVPQGGTASPITGDFNGDGKMDLALFRNVNCVTGYHIYECQVCDFCLT